MTTTTATEEPFEDSDRRIKYRRDAAIALLKTAIDVLLIASNKELATRARNLIIDADVHVQQLKTLLREKDFS